MRDIQEIYIYKDLFSKEQNSLRINKSNQKFINFDSVLIHPICLQLELGQFT